MNPIKKNTEALLEASKDGGLDVNTEINYVHCYVLSTKCGTESQFNDCYNKPLKMSQSSSIWVQSLQIKTAFTKKLTAY